MKLKKIAAVLLAVVLALGATACASPNARYIATVDGQSIPSGIYLNCLIDAYNEAYTKVEDSTKDILKQQVEGTPASDWVATRAEQLFRNYVAVEKQFDVQGLTLDEATLAALDQQAQYQWQMFGSIYDNNGISYESFLKVVTNAYKSDALFQAEYGPAGKTPVSDEELQTAFGENYFRARYITASLVDSDTGAALPEEGKQQVMDKMNTILANATAEGGDFSAAILASEKEQAVQDEREESMVHEHDETTHVYYMDKTNTGYPADFIAQIEAMGTGELKLLTTDTTAYLIQKLDIKEKPEEMEQYRSTLLYRIKGDAFDAEQETWASGIDIQYVAESKKLYTPSKLKFEM